MKPQRIDAIQTEYKGYKFRSRLEARWAIFFDTLGIEWIYEPEGFRLSDGSLYLPDFYLPESNTWVEVKGVLTIEDENKVYNFNISKDIGNVVIVGEFPPDVDDVVEWAYTKFKNHEAYTDGMMDFPYLPCICPTCGKFGFQFDGRGARICRHDDDDKGYTANHPRIKAAYKVARQARFEHGETPIIAQVIKITSNGDLIRTYDNKKLAKLLHKFQMSGADEQDILDWLAQDKSSINNLP